MFKAARLKLTAWYLLILAIISFAFSLTIYRYLSLEIDRFAKVQKSRLERRFEARIPEEIRIKLPPPPDFSDPDIVRESKQRVGTILLAVNTLILFVSGFLSYLLSGLTLKPIKQMVDDQDRFVSDASHELRTPLTSLKTSIEVALMNPNLSLAEAKKYLKENLTDVNNLSILATSLLELSRFQKGSSVLSLSSQNLKPLVEAAIFSLKSKIKSKKIKIVYKLGQTKISCDSKKITELLTILIDNAVKYSADGSRVNINSSKSKRFLTIKIQDQGIGIDEVDIPKIFDRFYRSDKARTKVSSDGFGLGLSIAKKIVDAHRGQIKVQSVSGQGSTFIVKLPIKS